MKNIKHILATIAIIILINILPLTKVSANDEQNETPSVLHVKANEVANLNLRAGTTINLVSSYRGASTPNASCISTTAGMNYVPLTWTNKGAGWSYRLYQKGASDAEFTTVSTKYNKTVKVLNIYPRAGMNHLKTWMQNYGKNLIQVDEVLKSNFNSEPDKYLKDTNGNYKYDVLMFGTCDYNGSGEGDGDISYEASVATENFIKTGRGVLFGHDTILSYHGNFNRLLSYMKMTLRKW